MVAPVEAVEHAQGDLADGVLVGGNPLGVKPAWKSILRRSCLGGSMPMNIARISSSGNPSAIAVTPPTSEENVFQSRLTAWMSSGRVIDQ